MIYKNIGILKKIWIYNSYTLFKKKVASEFLTVVKLVLHVSTAILEELEFIDSVLFVEGT